MGVKKMGKEDNNGRYCPECGSRNIITNFIKGEISCDDCGLVITENIIDPGQEWRAYNHRDESKKARTGGPTMPMFHDEGLGSVTYTEWGNKYPRLRKRQYLTNKEKTLASSLIEIERMCSALKLPKNIKEATSVLYRKAMKQGLTNGRSMEARTTAILRIICEQYGVPRSIEEITDISRVEQKEILRTYHYLKRELGIKLSVVSPTEFVPRLCSELNLTGKVREFAKRIIQEAEKKELTNGQGPIGIAGAAIYFAAKLNKERRTQKKVSAVTGITECTIRKHYREMSEQLEIEKMDIFL